MPADMHDSRLLARIWNWLPAFREVARTQHLPTASKRLNVTASAISRSIRLLEDAVGQPLFDRVGRRLVLNTAGERLLRAVDESSHAVEGVLRGLSNDPLDGPLRVSSLGVLTISYVLPTLLALRKKRPGLVPLLSLHSASEANDKLVRGEIDVAFYYDALSHDDLVIETLGESTASVYCGRRHSLFGRKRLTSAEIAKHPFSAPGIGDKGVSMDGWPVELARTIGMQITLLSTNVEVCLDGQFVTVLPDVIAAPLVAQQRISRLPLNVVPPVVLFGARRLKDSNDSASVQLIRAVTKRVKTVNRRVERLNHSE